MYRKRGIQALFLASLSLLTSAETSAYQLKRESVMTGDGLRTYLVARPDPAGDRAMPLILLFHGHLGNAAQVLGQERSAAPMSLWLNHVDSDRIVVAALDGRRGSDGKTGWNDCRPSKENPKTDDVGFAKAVAKRLIREDHADPARIFAMGMSNGGMFSFRLASEMQPALAGFAAVSSSAAADSRCTPPIRPVPMLIIHGTADPVLPYGGGGVGLGKHERAGVIGVEATVEAALASFGLSGPGQTETLTASETGRQGTSAAITRWRDPGGLVRIERVTIEGGGHIEPSIRERVNRLYERIVGQQNHDLESVEEAWAFFRQQPSTSGR